MTDLITRLRALGFETNQPINGAAVVDLINEYWFELISVSEHLNQLQRNNDRYLRCIQVTLDHAKAGTPLADV